MEAPGHATCHADVNMGPVSADINMGPVSADVSMVNVMSALTRSAVSGSAGQ